MNRATVLTTSQLRQGRFLYQLGMLAIAPMLLFAACSSGDDGGGGGTTTNNQGGGTQFAYVIASAASQIQANTLDGSGNLTAIGTPIATGTTPHHVDVDRANRFVYVSNHDSAFVSGWSINQQNGSLVPMNPATGSPVTADVEPHSSVTDQTGGFLYVVAGTGASTVKGYTINASTGLPTAIGQAPLAVGTHGHNVTISPNNLFLYVAAEGTGEVHAFSRDTTTGNLTAQGVMSGMLLCDAVVVSNDNKFLYAAYTNAVDVFSIDPSTGALTRIGTFSTNNAGGGSGPHSMALSPNGLNLYTANINSGTVSVFGVNTSTGALTELQSPPVPTGPQPNFVAIHPNGLFLFTADATAAGEVSRFSINAGGTLAAPPTSIPNTGSGTNGIGITKF